MKTIRLLLVDDEAEFTSGLGKVMRRRGMEVEVAGDGETALKLASSSPFQVVLLDIKMPGLDGIQVLKELKQITPSTEVILMTGHLSANEENEGTKAGAFAYLLKPHPIQDLMVVIQRAALQSLSSQGKEDSAS